MFNYAQIDQEGYVIGISNLSGEVIQEDMILIKENEAIQFAQRYNIENKVWTNEFRQIEIQEPITTDTELLQQQLTDIEIQNLEAQEERQLLAQQMSDLELIILGGNR